MAVSKKILRNLLGVKLAKIQLLEPSGLVAKSIYSVGAPGDPVDLRFFPHLAEAEVHFFEQVRKLEGRASRVESVSDLLHVRTRAAFRR